VSIGIIDAHAGGLGLLGAVWEGQAEPRPELLESALALIGGTSNCHMAVSRGPRYIDGVWGPYFGAMVPGMWLTEAGQSAAGSAIDHAIADHAHAPALAAEAKRQRTSVYELLNREIERLQAEAGAGPELTRHLHVLPDFLGNRSPHADPHSRALIDGLSLDTSITSQALRYYATLQGVAYGTRDIIATLNRGGYRIRKLFVTGGGVKNSLWLQEHADITGCEIILAREADAVLLGSAILAATAAGVHPDMLSAMQAMSGAGRTIRPRRETARYHQAKFAVFRNLYRQQLRHRAQMEKIAQ
jgi:D-ribulokinase